MGNNMSSTDSFEGRREELEKENLESTKEIIEKVNQVAANYITNLSIPDMEALLDEEYCRKVEVITSKLFLDRVKMHEVDVLVQKTSKGEKINQKETNDVAIVVHKDKEHMKKREKFLKKQYCQSIAKFYIKIAHLYAAIVKTVDPQFDNGNTDLFSLYGINDDTPDSMKKNMKEKDAIMSDVFNGFCFQRIRSLIQLLPVYKNIQYEQEGGNVPGGDFMNSEPFFKNKEQQPGPVEPLVEQPGPVEPVVEQPGPVEPLVEQPVPVEPVVEQPGPVEPVVEQPGPVEPVVEQPGPVEPVVEQPVPVEPVVEQPDPVEHVVEQPGHVEPVVEQSSSVMEQTDNVEQQPPAPVMEQTDNVEQQPPVVIEDNTKGVCSPGMNQIDFKAFDKLFSDMFNYDLRGTSGEDSTTQTEFKPKYVMSEESKEKKKEILKQFYKTFTGKDYDGEEELTKFSQIKLTDFSSSDICRVPATLTSKSIESGSVQTKLMNYAAFIQNMLYDVNKKYESLIEILRKMFYFTDENKIIIHPKLNDLENIDNLVGHQREYNLTILVNETREIITSMYIDCETKFQEGVEEFEKLREAIIKYNNE